MRVIAPILLTLILLGSFPG